MKNIRIVGCGYALAEHSISNYDLEKVIDTSDEWITTRTGIKNRYLSETENTSDLGLRAAKNAIKDAGIDKNEIDLIIVATITPDYFTPSCASMIQGRLGLNGNQVMAFDLNAACSGFLYSLEVAAFLLSKCHCALVIGAEILSKIVDWSDRNTCVLFGDGSGAIVMKNEETNKDVFFYSQSIGDTEGVLQAKGLSLHKPLENAEKNYGYLHMDGSEVFKFAVKAVETAIEKMLEESKKTIDEIDLIIPHQANIRIIQSVAKHMNVDIKKFYLNIDKIGNVSAASIPIAFAQAKEEGLIKEGMKIIFVGFGGGFTYASAYYEV